MRHAARWLLASSALLAACSKGDSGERAGVWRAERDTLADTVVVRTVSGSMRGPGRLERRMSIGIAEGDEEEYLLGRMQAIAVARDGSVYISDAGPALRKYGPDGVFVRTFGRAGGGPGEYRRPDAGLAVLPDGRLVIRDPGNGRMSVFTADGEPLTTWTIASTFNSGRRLYVDTAGNLYTEVIVEPGTGPGDWRLGLARISPDGILKDSVPEPTWDFERRIISRQREGNVMFNDVPFSPEPHWTLSPFGYFIGGASTQYRIDLFRRGAPVLRIERTAAPVVVASAEAADHRRAATANMRVSFPGWTWNGPDIPSTKPPFRDIFAAEDGRIWVMLSRPGIEPVGPAPEASPGQYSSPTWTEPVAFDVFEADGIYLGEVTAPEGFLRYPEPVFRGDTVWAAIEDAGGVRYVWRLEVVLGD